MKKFLLSVLAIFLLFPVAGFTQGYLSATYGNADLDLKGLDFADSFFDDADIWTVTGGYKVSDYFAVEASYIDLGKFKIKDMPSLWVGGDAFDLGIVGMIPLSENFNLFARAGYMQWDVKSSLGDREDGHDYNFGLGAEYSFNDRFSLIAEYKRFQFDDDDGPDDLAIDAYSIGVRVFF